MVLSWHFISDEWCFISFLVLFISFHLPSFPFIFLCNVGSKPNNLHWKNERDGKSERQLANESKENDKRKTKNEKRLSRYLFILYWFSFFFFLFLYSLSLCFYVFFSATRLSGTGTLSKGSRRVVKEKKMKQKTRDEKIKMKWNKMRWSRSFTINISSSGFIFHLSFRSLSFY